MSPIPTLTGITRKGITIMKHVFFVICTSIALSIGVARCGSGMSDVRSRAHNDTCDLSCKETYDSCSSKCTADSVDESRLSACRIACSEAQDKCAKECRNH